MANVILTTKGIRLQGFSHIRDVLVIHFTTSGFTLRNRAPYSPLGCSLAYEVTNFEVKDEVLAAFFQNLYPRKTSILFLDMDGVYFPYPVKKCKSLEVLHLVRSSSVKEVYIGPKM